ncbi:hypothetical protein M9M90_08310 [Phenylobacterium sp. LH3H17]|uniref:hypothetical protein n=1 Tax=Phenylobacterium sp. LH3H17 TaxID=2903901 RepID=UPI0020C976FC|nr:hypothetical protein [Phenylobacterium sp. LH3H17]UTP41567.1 hypothetical protein M9M90_08310 [Phenylobacterium sp. LH3H17]
MRTESRATPTLAEKVAFLSTAAAHPGHEGPISFRETHMSWLFFLDGAVYKLKKPVRFPYLDFSTLARREAACRAELALNQRLAPNIYEAVVPIVATAGGLALGGDGEVVDWLVRMRRFDPAQTLEARLVAGELTAQELDALGGFLARFYQRAARVHITPAAYLRSFRNGLAYHRRVLLEPRLGLPVGLVRGVLAAQLRFLRTQGDLLETRVHQARILDAHGDLRPEHIWMGPPVKVIDRLEFSASLRAVDPLDELAFLDLETERLGAPEVGARISRHVIAALHERNASKVYLFYRCYRATLRARLAIAHLLEPAPRTPEKWPRQARAYLAMAARDGRRLDRLISKPTGP